MTIAIKLKLAALVAASCCITALIVKKGLDAGFPARYTLPFAVVVPLAVSLLLAHRMTAPLREMTTVAKAMARGDYGRSVRLTSHGPARARVRALLPGQPARHRRRHRSRPGDRPLGGRAARRGHQCR
jgi:hypothetical protein